MANQAEERASGGRLLSGTLWNVAGRGLPLLLALALTPVLVHQMGIERWGLFTLALALVGVFGVFDLGVGAALTRALSTRIGAGEHEGATGLAAAAISSLALLSLSVATIAFLFMPWLVRDGFTSLPPVSTTTVSERLSRGAASATIASHSSGDSRPPNTTTRGLRIVISTDTSRSPAHTRLGAPASAGSGTRTAGGSVWACTWPVDRASTRGCKVCSSDLSATASSQPLARMEAKTSSGRQPALACSMIHCRSSGVTIWVLLISIFWQCHPG